MKKTILFSLALILGAFMMFAQKPVNVADKYLDNHKYPFTYVNKFTADGDTVVDNDPNDAMLATNTLKVTVGGVEYDFYRFRKLGGPWKTNLIGEEGNWTGWHVDIQKGPQHAIKGALTLTNGWDGFAPSIDNAKVYQTTKATVPAGEYNFKVNWAQDRAGAEWTFFVVTKGNSLPDTTDLVSGSDTDVLGYVRLSDSTNVKLNIGSDQNLTIGLVASFPEKAEAGKGYSVAMGSFEIIKMIEGLTNYTEIKSLVASAEEMEGSAYPIGTTGGTYPQEKWDAFVAARTAAKAIIEAENTDGDPTLPDFVDTNTQEEVDAAVANLKSAIEELNKSFILPFKLSTADKEVWYIIHDRRNPTWYWTIDEAELNGQYIPRLLNTVKDNVDESLEKYQFKFVENTNGDGYLAYNKMYSETPLSINSSASNFIQIASGEATGWLIKAAIGNHPNYYRIYNAEDATQQLNTYTTQGGIIGFWNPTGEDPGNDFVFKRVYLEGEINMTALKDAYAKVFSVSGNNFPIGDAPGQFPQEKWDAFVTARSEALNIIETEDTANAPTDQSVVDNAAQTLNSAFDALVISMVPPVKFSNDQEEHWYVVKDKREYSYYWWYDKDNLQLGIKADSIADTSNDDAFQFKFVKPNDAVGNEFFIYSKVTEFAITYYVEESQTRIFAGFDADSDTTTFFTAKTPNYDSEYFIVHVNGDKTKQFNSNRGMNAVGFWNPGSADDPGNDWMFIPVENLGVSDVSALDLGIYVSNGMIKSRDNAKLNVYNISGQKVNTLKRLDAGVYIVAVEGKQGAVKVVIK